METSDVLVCPEGDFITTIQEKLDNHIKNHKDNITMKFTDETKAEPANNSNYFTFGVHPVKLMSFENGGLEDDQSEYVEVTVCDPEDTEKTDTVRLYFTEKAAQYSFNTFRQIAVHNAGNDKKDVARDAVDAVQDTDQLVQLLNEKLVGGEAWISKYYDPRRTYNNKAGDLKRSVNTNLYGYEPKVREDLLNIQPLGTDSATGGTDITNTDASSTVPKDGNWA